MPVNCLIVDDEPLSQEVLADFVALCPELNLAGICNDALEAGEVIKNSQIDLLFLDINMPKLSGIGFVKSLANPPLFIFVTAYPEYALDGFEVDAVDYLVKPVSFERFRKSVNRVLERLSQNSDSDHGHIMVRADKKKFRLKCDDILFLEARGDYVKFLTTRQSLMVHGRLKDFIELLPAKNFVQVHKSYVINILKVNYLEGNSVKIVEHRLPVSLNFKDQLLNKLAQ
ncbi:MAG TPA: LytTR family DNA-binding domain-containing protein [Tangfeifania sp.]|nr:LytTR family DNA-binding domain-containing protein [Tangfeifania sp.]